MDKNISSGELVATGALWRKEEKNLVFEDCKKFKEQRA